MENFQVEITSRDIIKPSTPTPPHLRSYKLCLFDQLFRPIYIPLVLFFQTTIHHDHKTVVDGLKESLSKTLSVFYPVAGRINTDESSMDCNDGGASFIVARVKGSLSNFLQSPTRVELLRNFLPNDIYNSNGSKREMSVTDIIPLLVQVNMFDCGGIAIGYQVLHKIVDGTSWGCFLKTWETFAASGEPNELVAPDFTSAYTLFPPCTVNLTAGTIPIQPLDSVQEGSGCTVKVFCFSPKAIASLQTQGKSESVTRPSRVEAVSAFIWKHATMAAVSKSKTLLGLTYPTKSILTQTLDIRYFTRPTIPTSTIGNLIINTIGQWELDDQELCIGDLVAEIRRGICQARNTEFLNKFLHKEGTKVILKYRENEAKIGKDPDVMNTYKFTGWTRRVFNLDFGFGIPVWIGYCGGKLSSTYKNLIPLVDTIDNGIEAWLGLDEQEMAFLESDSKFLEMVTPIHSLSPQNVVFGSVTTLPFFSSNLGDNF